MSTGALRFIVFGGGTPPLFGLEEFDLDNPIGAGELRGDVFVRGGGELDGVIVCGGDEWDDPLTANLVFWLFGEE